ncbi:hypothetical protein NLG97_g7772 [Lecanicillium saksenae]|uniref:Uncharacterized protein n=1 Tax=Lecanicillium saksenae TaxID=468837 RepID=A0ACC1QMF0_9HYPO|nr:hypothetical protein NLG97_g7772 [Lecanicillium saksenae]
MGHDEDRNLRGGDGGESGEDRQKREFAERWFRKRPLTGEQHEAEMDGAADAASQDGNSTREYNVGASGGGPSNVMDSTLSAPAIPRTMYPAEDVAQSMGSTVIESGSEVESCDWNEMYQSIRGLKIDSANSI